MRYAVLLLLAAAASAQDATITGRVELFGQEPPSGAVTLKLESEPNLSYTVKLDYGAFRFFNLPPGEYTLEYREPGFKRLTVKAIRIGAGEQKALPLLEAQLGCLAVRPPNPFSITRSF
jgi:hypothetical protein